MASKKTGKKKGKKKARTAAQKAATAKLVAMNKGKKKASKKKSSKKRKKASKKASKKGGWRQHSVGTKAKPKYHSNLSGPYTPHKRYKPSLGEQFAGERGGQRFHGPVTPTQALEAANREIARLTRASGGHKKKRSKKMTKAHHHSGVTKHSGVVTAASILRGAKSQQLKVYVCAGKRFSGCGGGKKGSHVVGHLRA